MCSSIPIVCYKESANDFAANERIYNELGNRSEEGILQGAIKMNLYPDDDLDDESDIKEENLHEEYEWFVSNNYSDIDATINHLSKILKYIDTEIGLNFFHESETILFLFSILHLDNVYIIDLCLKILIHLIKLPGNIELLLMNNFQEYFNGIIKGYGDLIDTSELLPEHVLTVIKFLKTMAKPPTSFDFFSPKPIYFLSLALSYEQDYIKQEVFITLNRILALANGNKKDIDIFITFGFLITSFERLFHQETDFISACELIGSMLVRIPSAINYIPANFSSLVLQIFDSNVPQYRTEIIKLLVYILQRKEVANIVIDVPDIMNYILRLNEEGDYNERVSALDFICTAFDMHLNKMKKWIIELESLDLFVSYLDMENLDIIDKILYSLTMIINKYSQIGDSEVFDVFQNSEELKSRLHELAQRMKAENEEKRYLEIEYITSLID